MIVNLMVLCACTNQQLYDGLRTRNQAECRELPVAQQQDCLDSVDTPAYREYQREIKKAAE